MARPQSNSLVYLAFFCTGVAFALPGVLLPAFLTRWQWDDRHGAWFFLLIAAGSLLAPLAIRRRPRLAVIAGCALVAAVAAIWISAWLSPARVAATCLAAPAWGFGLSLVMTGISLRCQSLSARPAVLLLRLNFLWSLGAVSAPVLRLLLLRASGVPFLLAALAFVFTALAVAAALQGTRETSEAGPSEGTPSLRGIPVRLILVTALATGVEASTGAWLTTYATRMHLTASTGLSATASFWAGLLISRSLSWRTSARSRSANALRCLLAIAAAAALSMLWPTMAPMPAPMPPSLLLISSFALGFGLGPLYPEFLSRILSLRPTTLIFTACGTVSAIMPWLAGEISSYAGSLQFGFLIPAAGALVMLVSGWAAIMPARSPQSPPAA